MCRINVFPSFVGAWIVQALVASVSLLSTIRPSDFFYVFTTFSAIAFKGFVVDFGRRWKIAIKLSNFQWFLVYESSLVFVRRSHFSFAYKTQAQVELWTTSNSSLFMKSCSSRYKKVCVNRQRPNQWISWQWDPWHSVGTLIVCSARNHNHQDKVNNSMWQRVFTTFQFMRVISLLTDLS